MLGGAFFGTLQHDRTYVYCRHSRDVIYCSVGAITFALNGLYAVLITPLPMHEGLFLLSKSGKKGCFDGGKMIENEVLCGKQLNKCYEELEIG